ncbi:unnamed protein product [Ilex paraguariensis]|uniref:Uncharacterized protein n=1 Tax=Ilex paraguariensis TaxID=185542 RepID=A0ABC8T2E2_9AQUA
MANASSKGKEKTSCSGKRNENTVIQVETNDNVISKRQLAQQAQKERERLKRPPIQSRKNIDVVIHDDCDVNRLGIVEVVPCLIFFVYCQ